MKMKNMERALGRTQGLRISREVFTVIRQLTVFDPDDAVCRLQDTFIVGSDDDADICDEVIGNARSCCPRCALH